MTSTDLTIRHEDLAALPDHFKWLLQKLDPPFQGADDPRLPVFNNVMRAIEDPLFFDDVRRRVETHQAYNSISFIRGNIGHYAYVAMKQMPNRLLDVAERQIEKERGPRMLEVSKQFLLDNHSHLIDWENEPELAEACESGETLPAVIANQTVSIRGRHDMKDIAERAAQFVTTEIATHLADHAVGLRIRDMTMEYEARADLFGRGFAEKDIAALRKAMFDDLNEGRLDFADFVHRTPGAKASPAKRIARILKLDRDDYASASDFLAELEKNLEKLQSGGGLDGLDNTTGASRSTRPMKAPRYLH